MTGSDGRERQVIGTRWSYALCRRLLDGDPANLPDDLLDPMLRETYWQEQAFGFRTRADAMESALR